MTHLIVLFVVTLVAIFTLLHNETILNVLVFLVLIERIVERSIANVVTAVGLEAVRQSIFFDNARIITAAGLRQPR